MLRMLIIAVGLALGLAFPIAHGSHAKNSGNGGSVDEVGEDRQQPEADDDEVDDESAKPPVVAGFT